MELVIVDLEDLDCAETGAIGWILLVVATVVAKMDYKNEIYMKNWVKST